MYSQQTVVFVHVATKCSYWNKCSVCFSFLFPHKRALPTAVVSSVDNLTTEYTQTVYHSQASVGNLSEHVEVHQNGHLADILRIYIWLFLFFTPVQTGPGTHAATCIEDTGALSRGGGGVAWPRHGSHHPPQSSPEVKND